MDMFVSVHILLNDLFEYHLQENEWIEIFSIHFH